MDSRTLVEARNKRIHVEALATQLKTFIENFDVSQGLCHDITERRQRLTELWKQFDTI